MSDITDLNDLAEASRAYVKMAQPQNDLPRERIDYEYFRNIPIRDVIEALGLEPEQVSHGRKPTKWHSPLREDRHPSLTINENEDSRHYNQWRDWAASEGGSTIDLVIAAKYGLPPSQCHVPGAHMREKLGAVHFLEEHFPGGIENIRPSEDAIYPPVPQIPYAIIRECGLKRNPFHDTTLWDGAMSHRAEIMLDAIQARKKELTDYVQSVLVNFPRIGPKTSEYIVATGKEWTKDLDHYENLVQEFYLAALDVEAEYDPAVLEGFHEDKMEADLAREMKYLASHPEAEADEKRFRGYAPAQAAAEESVEEESNER